MKLAKWKKSWCQGQPHSNGCFLSCTRRIHYGRWAKDWCMEENDHGVPWNSMIADEATMVEYVLWFSEQLIAFLKVRGAATMIWWRMLGLALNVGWDHHCSLLIIVTWSHTCVDFFCTWKMSGWWLWLHAKEVIHSTLLQRQSVY